MATMVTLLMGNYQLDMTLATACDTDVADHCNIEKNMKREGNVCVEHIQTIVYTCILHDDILLTHTYSTLYVYQT